jgi:hypothetical protein
VIAIFAVTLIILGAVKLEKVQPIMGRVVGFI